MYVCVERDRLEFLRKNQDTLRAEVYAGIRESIHNETDSIGRKVVLPSSFSCGPRAMSQLYQDAMALMRVHGKPSLFITMTANPTWPEITRELKGSQKSTDRPDLVARVFHLKLKDLIKDLVEGQRLGQVISHVYTIEFQKRGLPHAHLMFTLARMHIPRTTEAVDCLISASIPDPNIEPRLHQIVRTCMIHGPCDSTRPCWKENRCKLGFPKPFSNDTFFVENVINICRYDLSVISTLRSLLGYPL